MVTKQSLYLTLSSYRANGLFMYDCLEAECFPIRRRPWVAARVWLGSACCVHMVLCLTPGLGGAHPRHTKPLHGVAQTVNEALKGGPLSQQPSTKCFGPKPRTRQGRVFYAEVHTSSSELSLGSLSSEALKEAALGSR